MRDIEKKIAAKIHRFDLHALLALLSSIGYSGDEILFKSHLSFKSNNGLLQEIAFKLKPVRQVVITVNLGMLSLESPLPSYFTKIIEMENIDDKGLVDFISFFDHVTIVNYLNSVYPELDEKLYANWQSTKRNYLRLLDLTTENFLHSIFQLTFPELGVLAGKSKHDRELQAQSFCLGQSALGDSPILGARTTVAVPGFDIFLLCDDEIMENGEAWAEEVFRRLQQTIFPILGEYEAHIKVVLIIRTQKSWVKLKQKSYLGIDRIRGGEEKNRKVMIFRGLVPFSECI